MKAAVRDRYGSVDVVRLDDVERPTPADDDVLVQVRAASVNRADLDALGPRPGITRLFLGIRRPRAHRLGCDMAGVVESVGASVTRFRPGDRVFGDLYPYGQSAFAEVVSVPARGLQAVPSEMTFEEAATLPHSAILALQGLRLRSGRTIHAGDKVLIDGASGNVGPFAVQIAKAMGAEVTGSCSTAKMDLVRSLGADRVIDYTKVDYTREGERYDWILDVDGHHRMLRCRRALAPKGVYVTIGGSNLTLFEALWLGPLLTMVGDRYLGLMFWWKPFKAEDVATITRLIADDKVRTIIDRRFPLAEVVDALRYFDSRQARGKVIVTV
jgi:NADPH:quinone reductase-like Zn-dependent oxidoreductase